MSAQPKVHLDRDGRARCGNKGARALTADTQAVTCGMCINMANGTHGIGNTNRQPESQHGTAARYRSHLRREGPPVRCEACLQAERRRMRDFRRAA